MRASLSCVLRFMSVFQPGRWFAHVAICCLFASAMAQTVPSLAEDENNVLPADTVIAGSTVDIWRTRMKNLNPADPGAVAYVPGMIALIQERQLPEFTRRQAAHTLGRMGAAANSAVPALLEILNAEDAPSTRLWVLKSFMLFGPVASDAAPRLAELVRSVDSPHLLRVAALEALARIGPQRPEVLPVLMVAVRGDLPAKNPQVANELRMSGADVLSILGPGAAPAIPDLIHAATADWPLLRLSAVTTIGQIGPAAEIAVPALADVLLFDDADEVRDAAARALGMTGAPSLPVFEQFADEHDVAIRERVVLGLVTMVMPDTKLLSQFLDDVDLELRVRAARRLLMEPTCEQAALGTLMDCLATSDPRVQRHAYEALRDHPDAWNIDDPRLANLSQHENSRIRDLVRRLRDLE